MTTLKLTDEQVKLFDSLGYCVILGTRKATIIPYILVSHADQPKGEVELISMVEAPKELEDYARLFDPNFANDVE